VASPHARLPLVCIAAVHDRVVVSPCGSCRQMLFDLDPDIRAVVRTKIGPPRSRPGEAVPVRDFLSYVSDWRAVEPDVSQRQYVWEDRLEDIRADR